MSIIGTHKLLDAATTTATGDTKTLNKPNQVYLPVHGWGTTSAGVGAAVIHIEVSNDTTAPWLTAGTITLTLGTSATADGFAIQAGWMYIRARVESISGTNASVSVVLGS